MALRQEQVDVNGEIYVVRELSARELIPLIEAANTEAGEDGKTRATYAESVFEQAVSVDGARLTLDEVGGSAYLRLLPIVLRINGLAQREETAGNA